MTLRQRLISLTAAALLAGCTILPLQPASSPDGTVSVQALMQAMVQSANPVALIVDVRAPAEFAAGHVPSALNVPLDRLASWAEGRDRHQALLLICQSGSRSAQALQELAARGFDNVRHVVGGTSAWVQQGYSLVRE